MNKILYYLQRPYRILIAILRRVDIPFCDALYLKLIYQERIGRNLNFNNPKSFNEKIQWLKLYDRNPLYTELVDKYEVKNWVSQKIPNGEKYIIPTIGIYGSFAEIDFDRLPTSFVIKCTHDCGSTILCKNKKIFDLNQAEKTLKNKFKRNYFYHGREWAYKNVKPRIIIEEYLEEITDDLLDYKLMCFNGKVKCSFVCSERRSKDGLKVTFFDRYWKKMPFERHYPSAQKEIKKPKNYEKMIELAEKLSEGIPFVRVDFYNINGRIYFGEMTFYPGNGMEEFRPEEWDYKLGQWLELPKNK